MTARDRDVYIWAPGACARCPTLRRIGSGLEALRALDPDSDDIEDLAAMACGSCAGERPSLGLDDAGRLILELSPA